MGVLISTFSLTLVLVTTSTVRYVGPGEELVVLLSGWVAPGSFRSLHDGHHFTWWIFGEAVHHGAYFNRPFGLGSCFHKLVCVGQPSLLLLGQAVGSGIGEVGEDGGLVVKMETTALSKEKDVVVAESWKTLASVQLVTVEQL